MTSWPQNAYVGQKVVCVKLINVIDPVMRQRPVIIGNIYTIAEILIYKNKLYFKIKEAYFASDGHPQNWLADNFRPVQSTDTGMSILKELLINPHKVLEDA